jgi:hypothetical protein
MLLRSCACTKCATRKSGDENENSGDCCLALVGLEVVRQGLERGHDITALLRNHAKLELDHSRLRKVKGDAGNAADVN